MLFGSELCRNTMHPHVNSSLFCRVPDELKLIQSHRIQIYIYHTV